MPRIRCVQARLIGEYQQQVGLHQVGHQRRERIVVAQLDLVGSDRVVFVDHGHDTLGQQRLQRIAGVEVAAAVVEIGPRQQHLAHDDVVDAEELLVVLHQPDLADRGQHLFGGHGLGELPEAQALTAGGDGGGGDHHHIHAGSVQSGALANQLQQPRPVDLRRAGGQDAGAEFEDEALVRWD